MADSLATDIKATLGWSFTDALDLSTVGDSSQLEYSEQLADGTAADLADKIWHDQRTLAGLATDDLDLTALTNTIFGSTVTISFAKVKALLIVNTSEVSGDILTAGGSGGNEWIAPFNAAGDKVQIPAESCLFLTNKKAGWTVTNGSADILRITNTHATNSITYRIAIAGTSA